MTTHSRVLAERRFVSWVSETVRVRLRGEPKASPVIHSSRDIHDFLRPFFHSLDHDREHFVVVAVNAKNRILGFALQSTGTLTTSLVHPRETFVFALTMRASGIVIAHSHPTGDPEPSDIDHDLTHRLRLAGAMIGIPILDHVILGAAPDYVSFCDRGWIAPME